MAESVLSSSHAVAKASRYTHSIPLARVCPDLLATTPGSITVGVPILADLPQTAFATRVGAPAFSAQTDTGSFNSCIRRLADCRVFANQQNAFLTVVSMGDRRTPGSHIALRENAWIHPWQYELAARNTSRRLLGITAGRHSKMASPSTAPTNCRRL